MTITRATSFGLAVTAALALGGCEKQPGPAPSAHKGKPAPAHDHGHDHDDGDHDHAHSADQKHELGTATIGAYNVSATRYGQPAPGKEIEVDLRAAGSTAPTALRLWIGTQDARGSLKAKAEPEADHHHAHVEVPDPLPPDARLWVEIETGSGPPAVGSFALHD